MLRLELALSVDLGRRSRNTTDWFDRLAEKADGALTSQDKARDHAQLRAQQIVTFGPQLTALIFDTVEASAKRFNERFHGEEQRIQLISKNPNGSSIKCQRTYYPSVLMELEAGNGLLTCKISTRKSDVDAYHEQVHRFRYEVDSNGTVYVKGDGGLYSEDKIAEICLTPFFNFQR